MSKVKKVEVTVEDLANAVKLIDTIVNNKWAKDVPIVPGRPQDLGK